MSKAPLLRRPLATAAPERLSLRMSYLSYGGACLAAGAGGLASHAYFLWLVPLCLVLVAILNPRRIEVDESSLVLVPLFGFPKQRLALSALGPFELRNLLGRQSDGRLALIWVSVDRDQHYRVRYLFPSTTLKIPALYGTSHLSRSLRPSELLAALDRARQPSTAAPQPVAFDTARTAGTNDGQGSPHTRADRCSCGGFISPKRRGEGATKCLLCAGAA